MVASRIAKRIPLIKFPNRRGPQATSSEAPPRPSSRPKEGTELQGGTATSQPPRTKVSAKEIEAILLGGMD